MFRFHNVLQMVLAVGTAATLVPAIAADLPQRMGPPAPIVSVAAPNWSGLYVGAHVGYGVGDFDFRDPSSTFSVPGFVLPNAGVVTLPFSLARTYDGDGIVGGGQVGYNAQFGSLVLGVEGDLSGTGIDGKFRSTAGPFPFAGIGGIGAGIITSSEGVANDLEWLGTVRGRIGWAFDRWLVYGTGGVAFGRVGAAADITIFNGPQSLTLTTSDSRTHTGWAAGVGVEGMITPNVSAKLEYLYADLGSETHVAPGVLTGTPGILALFPPGTSVQTRGDFKVEVHTVRVGLNYRFHLFNY
jgi:outer membrane immunogenic protein